jgi:ArsR family transcriptional regulator
MSGLDHGPIAAAPLEPAEAEALARLLHALADRTRVAIVSAIVHSPDGELNARQLQAMVDVSQPTVSHHLRKLLEAGLLHREQRGPYGYFRLAPEAFERLCAIFSEAA